MIIALFAVVGASLLLAVFCGAPLVEDGAYYLVVLLESGSPIVPHGRDLNRLLQIPALTAMRQSDDVDVIISAFGLPYASIPWLAWLACFLIVRRNAARLFLWPSLGILLMNLPMQIIFIAESTHAICAFWVVWTAYLVSVKSGAVNRPAFPPSAASWPRSRRAAAGLLTLTAALVCVWSHPVAIILFSAAFALAASGAGFCRGNRDQRRIQSRWALVFLGFAVLASVRLLQVWNNHARDETSFQLLQELFWLGVRTAPIGALGLILGAAILVSINSGMTRIAVAERQPPESLSILRSRIVRWSTSPGRVRTLNWTALWLLVIAAALLMIWASEPRLWKWSISFRRFYPLFVLPVLAASLCDAIMSSEDRDLAMCRIDRARLAMISVAGVTFAAVVSIQSLQWAAFGRTVLKTLTARPALFQAWESESWLDESPILGWTLPSYSLLLQGKHPRRVYLNAPFLSVAEQGLGLRIAPWDLKSFDGGWFDFSALKPSPSPYSRGIPKPKTRPVRKSESRTQVFARMRSELRHSSSSITPTARRSLAALRPASGCGTAPSSRRGADPGAS